MTLHKVNIYIGTCCQWSYDRQVHPSYFCKQQQQRWAYIDVFKDEFMFQLSNILVTCLQWPGRSNEALVLDVNSDVIAYAAVMHTGPECTKQNNLHNKVIIVKF